MDIGLQMGQLKHAVKLLIYVEYAEDHFYTGY